MENVEKVVFSDTKTQFVVINEHTFAYHQPGSSRLGVLSESVIKGAPFRVWPEPIAIPADGVRFATKQDFEDFRVNLAQYDHDPNYEISVDCCLTYEPIGLQ